MNPLSRLDTMSHRKSIKEIQTRLATAKLELLFRINNLEPDSPAREALIAQYVKLNEIDTTPKRARVSPDTIALIVANLAGILIIVCYEAGHVFVSQAKNHLIKPQI